MLGVRREGVSVASHALQDQGIIRYRRGHLSVIDRPARLIGQVTTTMINNLQQARLSAAHAAGQRMLHLTLDIDRRIGLWDTAAMPRIYELGRRAAEGQLHAIRRMLDVPLAA